MTVLAVASRVVGRLSARLAALLVVTAAVGLLPLLAGRDPALAVLRARSQERDPDPEALVAVRTELGLDGGPGAVLRRWLNGLLHGDLGVSWVSGGPIAPALVDGLAVSLTLTASAVLVASALAACVIARPLWRGVTARPGKSGAGFAAIWVALPEFLVASVLLTVVAVRWRALPPSGWDSVEYAVLPALALGIPAGGVLGIVGTDAVHAALAEPWVRAWRAAGFGPRRLATALIRRAAPVVCGQLALIVAGLVGGAVAVEVIFAVPGVGRAAAEAALAQDIPVVQACVLVMLVLGMVAGWLGRALQRALLGPALVNGGLAAAPVGPAPGRLRARVFVPVVVVLVALLITALTREPGGVDLALRLRPPSLGHPLGTDPVGRDVLARLGHGALQTAGVALVVTAVCLVIGVAAGMAGGNGPTETANALPPVVVGLIGATVLAPGTFSAAVAVGAVAWAPLAGHTRSLAVEQFASPHLRASRALGAGRVRLLLRHVLPAVVPPVARHALARLPVVALSMASLGFLGLGAQPPSPEWGRLLAESLPYAERAPWTVAGPAIALAGLGVAALSLGNRLR